MPFILFKIILYYFLYIDKRDGRVEKEKQTEIRWNRLERSKSL